MADYHWTPKGKLAEGLIGTSDLKNVINELEDPELAAKLEAILAARKQTLQDRNLPMLKGKGFIVIDPKNPRFTGEEHEDFEAAKDEGSNIAYQSGVAIVYAPVLVMKPKRETAQSQPSDLLKQLSLPGQPVAITGGETK